MGNASTKDDCPVCVETFASSDEVRILSCGHIYHHRCIDPWLLRVSGTCPICRTDLAKAISSTKAQNDAHMGKMCRVDTRTGMIMLPVLRVFSRQQPQAIQSNHFTVFRVTRIDPRISCMIETTAQMSQSNPTTVHSIPANQTLRRSLIGPLRLLRNATSIVSFNPFTASVLVVVSFMLNWPTRSAVVLTCGVIVFSIKSSSACSCIC